VDFSSKYLGKKYYIDDSKVLTFDCHPPNHPNLYKFFGTFLYLMPETDKRFYLPDVFLTSGNFL